MFRSSPLRAARALVAAIDNALPRLRLLSLDQAQTVCEPLEARRLMSVNVTTYHYDNSRDGANTNETTLTLANVNKNTFGKVASLPVDGQIYAQPLVMTGVPMAGGEGTHDILLVATENDTVYAFDADGNNPAQGYLWKTSLLQTGETAVPQSDYATNDITPELGITGTPVIDPTTNILYVVGNFVEANGSTFVQRIYALNISSGANAIAPVTIAASVPGTGDGGTNGIVTFSAYRENQRPALTLANGEVYIGYSSHGDEDPWHGWVLAYNAATLHQDYAYCDTPNGGEGGIWMSGGGFAVDSSGNLYFTTGNGTFDANTGGSDYSMAIVKLSPSLSVEDYFSPYNEANLSNADLDYGCASVVLLPTQSGSAPNEAFTGSKWGGLFLNNTNTGSLGEFSATTNNDLGQTTIGGDMHDGVSYWNGHGYTGGDGLPLESFNISNGTIAATPSSESANNFGQAGIDDGQGCNPIVSSNGTSNGIVWAVDNSGFTNNPAVVYAYNANNLSQLLWSSNQAAGGRDTAGDAVKFQSAVVANGYVYIGGANSVTIYGLITPSTATPTIVTPAAASPATVTGTTTSLSVLATDPAADLHPVYTWTASTTPAGAAAPVFSTNGTNASNDPTVTFSAAGNYTFTVTIIDPNSGLSATSSVNVVVQQVLSSVTISPASATLFDGSSQQFTAASVDQFGNSVTPQPTFTWSVSSGGAGGTVSSTGLYTAPANGTGTDTVNATGGGLTGSASVSVVASSATLPVSLSSYANRVGIVPDGSTFTAGLDGGGSAYSGNLLGTSQAWNGSTFTIPATTPNNSVNNIVYGAGQTISLIQYPFSALKLLATGTDGNQMGLTLTVNYTDGTTQTLTQSFSDWYTPQNFPGESIAVTMPYRDTSGAEDNRTFYLYGYNFTLNSAKTLSSITLPNDTNFEIISMDLVGVPSTGSPTLTTPAAANPSPVTGTTTNLSVLGTDPVGDAAPIYTWGTSNLPTGATTPSFSVNGTAAANDSTATFYQAGNYTLQVTITDPTSGLSTLSTVTVTVQQTLAGISISPTTAKVTDGSTKQFTAAAVDQFGQSMATQPSFTWSIVSGGIGSISTSGLYTAPVAGTGTATVQAASGTFTSQAAVTVANVGNAYFYPTQAGWDRAGVWQGLSGSDGGTGYTSPAGSTVLIAKNPNGGTLRDPYLLFNISNTAFAGDTINSVTLTFNAAALNQTGPVAFGVYGMTNTSWGATTADPSPAPTYPGSTEIGTTQNVGAVQGNYSSYTYSLGNAITNTTNGLLSLELNSPGVTSQETGIEIDNALNTPGADPVITVNYTVNQPAWLGSGSLATYSYATHILTVTGATTIIGDPGTDQPIIQANGSAAVVTINPATALQIHIGGLSLTNGASMIVSSLGSARTATNHRVLVLGNAGATTAPLLNIDSTSRLNLNDNDLVDHDGSLSAVTALLKSGFNAGAGYWNGNGIASSNAAAGTLTTLGSGQPAAAGTFDNETVSTSDVEVRYTYYGDATLDGHVDGSDYSKIDNGFVNHLTGFGNGDFNYDGVVDGSDYTLIDNAFNAQAASLAAQVAVPAAELATVATTVSHPSANFVATPPLLSSSPVRLSASLKAPFVLATPVLSNTAAAATSVDDEVKKIHFRRLAARGSKSVASLDSAIFSQVKILASDAD